MSRVTRLDGRDGVLCHGQLCTRAWKHCPQPRAALLGWSWLTASKQLPSVERGPHPKQRTGKNASRLLWDTASGWPPAGCHSRKDRERPDQPSKAPSDWSCSHWARPRASSKSQRAELSQMRTGPCRPAPPTNWFQDNKFRAWCVQVLRWPSTDLSATSVSTWCHFLIKHAFSENKRQHAAQSWDGTISLQPPQAPNPVCPEQVIYTAKIYDVFHAFPGCFHLFLNENSWEGGEVEVLACCLLCGEWASRPL